MIRLLSKISTWPQKYFTRDDTKFEETFNKALTLSEWGMLDVSTELYLKCLKIHPDKDFIHFKLAEDYRQLNKADKAIFHYRECLRIDESDPFGVSIKLHLLGEIDSLKFLPKEYVKRLFDQYAPHFETNLVERLEYIAPNLAHEALTKRNFLPRKILDLGCGTGLSAQYYKKDGVVIHGVDISDGMVTEAQKKNIYDELFCSDVFQFLKEAEQQYDLILALDLFIYIGDLDEMFSLVKNKLSREGLFVFSTQLCGEGYSLQEDHRFSHSDDYIKKSLKKSVMEIVESREFVIRTEHETPVQAMFYICKNV